MNAQASYDERDDDYVITIVFYDWKRGVLLMKYFPV